MNFLDISQVSGNQVDLLRTNPGHMISKVHPDQAADIKGSSFNDLVMSALDGVNTLAQDSTQLTEQYITNPDSVDVHDVTIAMGKANLAISLTKSVVDSALKAYREIINIR